METREKSGKAEVSENDPVHYVVEKADLASQEHRRRFVVTAIDLTILRLVIRLTYMKNMVTGNITDWDVDVKGNLGKPTGNVGMNPGNLPPLTINNQHMETIDDAGGGRTYVFRNTYKVLLDNVQDIDISPTNTYSYYAANAAGAIQDLTGLMPIYDDKVNLF